ncbi:class I SAM-dependent rRNA methyltransferase [Nitrogeniibacter mangrovi]|uniref:Class I SAM-dependent rRNA methyltransferase n=1 Tax=Nitrogeniibacter mangrovi TaxID=2016596 RepID=A0A6C1B5D1_9RHOO|nr:class I SAM-dependent methyltransferase [Nitrogeniibacter mangrovi]QID18005.1 class I SAM-dependent rRNA methyltransferase [Nitrogeniibacter mangrovi]
MPDHPTLPERLATALAARGDLLDALHTEATDCYRLFHGSAEGVPGLTIDRYGDLLLIQTFHTPLDAASLHQIRTFYATALPGLDCLYNDRSGANSRISNTLDATDLALAEQPRIVTEGGVKYRIRGRHAGQDPWLFLDLRAARRYVMAHAAGCRVLNLFAYTCGVGIAAAKGGARFVMNVDFAQSSLDVGKENARLNDLPVRPRFVRSDVFPAVRQLAGIGQPQRVRGRRMPPFPPLEPMLFDLVFLDPPRYAKSPFGVVDLVNDYTALFKPALLATRPGGTLICCNNVAQVDRDAWLDQLLRSARKAGRPIEESTWIEPDTDFPSFDANPPLKVVALRVSSAPSA